MITDSGVTEVEYGGNKTYTIAAETGKEIASVLVDGQLSLTLQEKIAYLMILKM